jgi:hypothetical protein
MTIEDTQPKGDAVTKQNESKKSALNRDPAVEYLRRKSGLSIPKKVQ